ncbi:hypothetical protein CIL06_11205 [Pantoea vagans]|nr:hypothetical protein CIL06_11205 [Pantoea vagans]
MPEPQQILPRSTPIIDVVFASTKPQYACWGSFCVKPAASRFPFSATSPEVTNLFHDINAASAGSAACRRA